MAGSLGVLLSAAAMSWSAADLADITDDRIGQLVESLATNDAERTTIRARLTGWKELLSAPGNRSAADPAKLRMVNDFMQRTPFYCDPVMWCAEDYWAKPAEFLANDGGDCEDFSIAKYFSLKALGVEDSKLRIVYAVYRRGGQGAFTGAHMVLAYYERPDAEPLILDNINHAILPASSRPDLDPIFSFNSGGLWSAKEQKGRGQPATPYRAWSDHWRRVQSDDAIRSITPEKRKSPECQALMQRSPWCG
ncbi:MAG: transglutaminase-like cysteine peptidase [Betaproteobacteria bacterium]